MSESPTSEPPSPGLPIAGPPMAEPSVPTAPSPPVAGPGDASVPPTAAQTDGADGARTGPETGAGQIPAAVPGHVTPDGLPKLTRRRDDAILGGVAGGVADHLHVPVLWVRTTFVLLALTGAGVLAYALLWIFVPQRARSAQEPPAPASSLERQQAIGIAAVGVALLIAATALGLGPGLSWVLVPLGLAAVGGQDDLIPGLRELALRSSTRSSSSGAPPW